MAAQAPSLPPDLGNRLASSDKTERDKALATATRFVKRLPNPPDTNTLLKLWKALYYTFWHSDKPLVQRDLAERLAALQASAPAAARGPFVAAFWATMMREWHSIDRIRLNKFYLLMEHVLEQQLRAMRAGRWADEALASYASVLTAGPLSPQSPRGLRYFLCDATLAAVAKVGLSIDDDDGAASRVVLALADPYLTLLSGASADSPACERVADKVLRPLLCGKVPETDAMPQPAVPALLGKRLLALAAEPSTRDSNRSFIYALQQEAEVAAAALGDAASGVAREPKKRASAEAKSSAKAQPKSSAKVVSALKGMLDKGVQKKTKVSEVTAPPPPPPPPPPPLARGREVEKVDSKKSKVPKAELRHARKVRVTPKSPPADGYVWVDCQFYGFWIAKAKAERYQPRHTQVQQVAA